VPNTKSSSIVVLFATTFLIAGCLFLVGCADDQEHERETGSITTGSTGAMPSQARSIRTTVVQPGETLFSIARQNNVTVYDLAASNSLSSTRLHVGQTLSIPSY
jgi:LysM repeat protein